jgi:hypothetical protein
MVHGNFYGIQYEIFINCNLDFYDDLLPIWTAVRARIELEKDKDAGINKLIIIPHEEFSQQLYNNKVFNSYSRENDQMSYSHESVRESFIRHSKYFMVRQYEKFVKHNKNLPEPMTKEQFDELVKEWERLEKIKFTEEKMNDDEWKEFNTKRSTTFNQLKIQRIIHDPEYFEEIKKLDKKILEQVNFTKEQSQIIQKVLAHPKFEGNVIWHGLNLIDGYY